MCQSHQRHTLSLLGLQHCRSRSLIASARFPMTTFPSVAHRCAWSPVTVSCQPLQGIGTDNAYSCHVESYARCSISCLKRHQKESQQVCSASEGVQDGAYKLGPQFTRLQAGLVMLSTYRAQYVIDAMERWRRKRTSELYQRGLELHTVKKALVTVPPSCCYCAALPVVDLRPRSTIKSFKHIVRMVWCFVCRLGL